MSFWPYCDGMQFPCNMEESGIHLISQMLLQTFKSNFKVFGLNLCAANVHDILFRVKGCSTKKKKGQAKCSFPLKIFFIYSSEDKQIVQIAVKTLPSLSGVNNSIYFPLYTYL